MRAGFTNISLRTLRTNLALDPLWPLLAGVTLRSLGTGLAGVTFVALNALGHVGRGGAVLVGDRDGAAALGGSHGGRGTETVDAILAVGTVEVAALGRRRQVLPRSVGQRGRSVRSRGGVGRDLGRVLVGVDGVHEQREPVLVPLAADDHGLHAYRENPRADIGVVPARHHHLRQHRALGFLHRGRVVDFERAGSSVDSGEQLRSALAGNLVPPHEVDGCPAEVGSSAVLPDGKRNPTPAGVGRRGNQHVAEPLVRSVPNQPVKSVSVEHEAPPRVSAQGMPASQPRRQKSRSASSSRSSMASVTVLSTICTEVATLRLPSMPATSFCSAATSAASELVTA